MRKLIIILIPLFSIIISHAQQVVADTNYYVNPAGGWFKTVTYRNTATSNIPTKNALADSIASVRAIINSGGTTDTAYINSRYQRVYQTLSGLKSLSLPITNGTVVNVLGYRTINDGGGGNYVWCDTCTTDDDGGGIIEIGSNPATGRFIHEVVNGVVNLKWWGIQAYNYVDTESYDIADEFNAAQNFMKRNSSWKILYIPSDTSGANGYYYSTQLRLKNSITIQGDNGYLEPRTRIMFYGTTSSIFIPFKGEDSVAMRTTINDIYILQSFAVNNFGDSTSHGIDARSQVSLNRVFIGGAKGNGINLVACQDSTSPINGTLDFSEVNNCTVRSSNNGIYIDGCDANKINIYKLNATAVRRWGVYDNGSLGNTYISPHFAFCGSGSGSNVVITYDSVFYCAINPDSIINVGFRPDLFPQYWRQCSAMGSGTAWNVNTRYWSGGAYIMLSPSANNTIIDPYFEAYQPDAINSVHTLSINGTRGVTIRGGVDMNATGSLGLNTSVQVSSVQGLEVNTPTTLSNFANVSLRSGTNRPTIFHENDATNVFERFKNSNNDDGYLNYNTTFFRFRPNDIDAIDITQSGIKPVGNDKDLGEAGTPFRNIYGNGSFLTGLTKSMVGLTNVDNTSDNSKPISAATQTALNGKQPTGSYLVAADIANKLNNNGDGSALTGLTKGQVSLGNADNTSDANKPISSATQTALNAKQPTLVSATNIKTVNGNTLLGSGDLVVGGGVAPTFINLAANFSSTIVTEAAVTGWNFAVVAGKTYRIEVIASYQTAATTTGGELGFFMSNSGVGTIRGYMEADIVNTAAASGLKIPITACTTADAAGSNLISTGVSAINTPQSFYAVVTFTCSVSGTFNVGWATEVAASSAQLNQNSSLIYQVLN